MTITDFFICALAASAIVDVWFNGSILADLRKLVEVKVDWCEAKDETTGPIGWEGLPGAIGPTGPADHTVESVDSIVNQCPCLVARMLSCAFCMSHHTPLWVFVWYFGVSCLPTAACEVLRLPVYILAASRLMNLITTFSGKPYQGTL